MMTWRFSLLIALAWVGFLSATHPVRSAEPVRVLASSLPAYCFAAQILKGLDGFVVEKLIGDHATPHDYRLSPSEIRKLRDADVVVIMGAGFDGWIEKAYHRTDPPRKSRQLVDLGMSVQKNLIPMGSRTGSQPVFNPHYWLDPGLSGSAVTHLSEVLSHVRPADAHAIQSNTTDYLKALHDTDLELKRILEPAAGRAIITQHDAFPYFANRYGLRVAEVLEEIPEVPPKPGKIRAIHAMAKQMNILALATEPGVSSKLMRQISRDLNIPIIELDPLDNGESSSEAYLEGMRRNAMAITAVLRRPGL